MWTSIRPGSFRRSGSISVRRVRSNSPWAGLNWNRRSTAPSGRFEPVLDPRFAATRQGYRMGPPSTYEKRDARWGRLVPSIGGNQADGLASGLVTGIDVLLQGFTPMVGPGGVA